MNEELIDALEWQVEKWRDKQEQLTLPQSGITGEGVAFKTCADDIEAILEEHTDE